MSKKIKFKILKQSFKELISAHAAHCSQYDNSVLSGVNLKVEKGSLIMASTDGNRLLKTETHISDENINFKAITYSGQVLRVLKIYKNIIRRETFPLLEVTLTNNSMVIFDIANDIKYTIPAIEGIFPKYEQLMPNIDERQKIAFNVNFLRDLKNLSVNERTNIIKFHFDKEDSHLPVIITAENPDTSTISTSLIMPVQIRN